MHFLKQSTASQSRLIGPFVDDGDFKALETGLTIANTDVKLSKNGAVGVDKNSGGGTHRNNGMYSVTFDATDTDTVGELKGSVSVAGALVVVFVYTVLEEAIYDALFAASAAGFDSNGRVDVGLWLGGAVPTPAATGVPDVNTTHINDSSAAAVNMALAAGQMTAGTVDNTAFTATTTILESDDITEADADHFNDRLIYFTSGNLQGQYTDITDYSLSTGRGRFTYTALTEAPADNDTFILL